jgi:hypothetical protein
MVNKHNKKQEKRRGQEKWFLSLIKFFTLFLIINCKNGCMHISRNRD